MSAFVQPFQISPSTTSLLSEEADIQAKLESIRSRLKNERAQCLPQLRQLIAKLGFSEDEIFPVPDKKKASVDKDYNPEYSYRNSETGEEWDGKGKRPAFLNRKKKTDDFRIYHATGTKYPPVASTKFAVAQSEMATSDLAADSAVMPAEKVSANAAVAADSVVASIAASPEDSVAQIIAVESLNIAAQQPSAIAALSPAAS
jgi:DNA-binding protein H-NS